MVRRPPEMELALLGFLLHTPQHGYQIHQMVSDPSGLGLIWHIKQSQLYALLNKLELDGYVTSVFQNQDPHPPRKVFELTNSGRVAFYEWLASPVAAPRLVRQHFFAKLYFAQKEGVSVVRKLFDLQRVVCEGWLLEFEADLSASKPTSFGWNMYRYRIGQVRALYTWLKSYEFEGGG
ncbi:MAG: PadR family transcriptional regulator [Anaerolineales bacterium]|nr:PadR family transcriptional regulator [Anaerolineales bacterium]